MIDVGTVTLFAWAFVALLLIEIAAYLVIF